MKGSTTTLQNVFKFEIYLWHKKWTFCYIITDQEILRQFIMSLKGLLQVTFSLPALPFIPLHARHAQLTLACMPNHIPVSSCPQKSESNHCCSVDGIPVKMRTSESQRICCLATSNPICPISLSCDKPWTGSSFRPSRAHMASIHNLLSSSWQCPTGFTVHWH